MQFPYTILPLDGLMAAQTSVGLVLGSAVVSRGWRPRIAAASILAAIAIAVLIPMITGPGDSRFFARAFFYDTIWLRAIGVPNETTLAIWALRVSAALATAAALWTRRRLLVAVSVVGEGALWFATGYVKESEAALAGAQLAFFGLLVGLAWRTDPAVEAPPADRDAGAAGSSPAWVDDAAAFAAGTLAAAIVCRVILHAWTDSADEWAYTFQAALFAKLRAYGSVPACADAFRNYWVFQYEGRSFAQYTPGWPYFMAPFVALRVPWLAGPASLGLLAAAVTRLARRGAAGFPRGADPPPEADARAAGRFAALVLILASTVLINGASRFSHVFVAGCFAWAVEALFAVAEPGLALGPQRAWGAVLGGSAGLMICARPADGAALGVGLLAYFVYALARRRPGWTAVGFALATFGLVSGVTLVVLRLELGRWFATGYSLTPSIYAWANFGWSLPKPNEYTWGLPFVAGAYCWWPCSPAVGLAGIATLRGRAQRLAFVLCLSYVPFVALYTLGEFGRGADFGYGPRFQLPWVVPMAVGTGVVLARLWRAARAPTSEVPALRAGGPAAVAMVAVFLGVLRIGPLVYPITFDDVRAHARVHEAIEEGRLHHAVVFAGEGTNNTGPLDLPENYPLDLYPDQDVLIANETAPDALQCVRANYGGRALYRAEPGVPLKIVPVSPASP